MGIPLFSSRWINPFLERPAPPSDPQDRPSERMNEWRNDDIQYNGQGTDLASVMDDGVAFLSFIHKFGSLYYAPFSLPMPAGLFWSPAFHFRRLSSRTLAPDPSCILLVRPCHLDMENKATSRESTANNDDKRMVIIESGTGPGNYSWWLWNTPGGWLALPWI